MQWRPYHAWEAVWYGVARKTALHILHIKVSCQLFTHPTGIVHKMALPCSRTPVPLSQTIVSDSAFSAAAAGAGIESKLVLYIKMDVRWRGELLSYAALSRLECHGWHLR